MEDRKEMMMTRAELILWSARKEAHRLRIDGLREKLLLEQEDVERMENGSVSAGRKACKGSEGP